MAKKIKQYKDFIIKKTTAKDNTTYKYWVYPAEDTTFIEWEADSFQECIDFIDSY